MTHVDTLVLLFRHEHIVRIQSEVITTQDNASNHSGGEEDINNKPGHTKTTYKNWVTRLMCWCVLRVASLCLVARGGVAVPTRKYIQQ